MSNETTLAVQAAPKASDQLASFLGIEKGMMLDTLKAQCFKGKRPDEVSDAQLAAFVSTANALQVNPLLPGFLYAYPERNGGITPILGPDGVMKKLDEMISSGKIRGYECDVKMGADGKPESATALIHRVGDQVAAKYTAYFSEWVVTSNPNWQTRPRHMLWVRAIKQAARQVIHGLPMDSDEYEISKLTNVTGTAEEPASPPVDRPPPKPRSPKGVSVVKENAVDVVATPVKESPKPVEQPAPDKAPEPVPAAPAEQPKAQEPAKPVQSFEQAAAATEAAPKAAPKAAPPTAVTQRALLNDGEPLTVTATIETFKTVTGTRGGNPHVYVTADIVSPELKGQVSQTDGGMGDDGKPRPVWQLDRPVVLKLRGKRYKSGTLINLVESIEEASAAGQQAVADDV